MPSLSPEENALYRRAEDLHPLHWETLRARGVEEAARAAGAAVDGGDLLLPLLGRILRVEPSRVRVGFADDPGAEVGYQRALVAVSYLAAAQDLPLRGVWVPFREMPGGDAFFRGPHAVATHRLEKAFGREPKRLLAAGMGLGGTPEEGADAAVELPALPRVPLRALLWVGTDEFGPSATLLTDARAHLHLPLDVLWALSNVAISDLTEAGR